MTTVFVHALTGRSGKWSRYTFPFPINGFGQLADDLYIRSGDKILRVVDGLLTDHVDGAEVPFGGVQQWPYIDSGTPGATKQMVGLDLVASGVPTISIGYDQSDMSRFTSGYTINPDTMPGGMIPFPLMAPTFSLKITFAPGTAWKVRSATLYLNETKGQP